MKKFAILFLTFGFLLAIFSSTTECQDDFDPGDYANEEIDQDISNDEGFENNEDYVLLTDNENDDDNDYQIDNTIPVDDNDEELDIRSVQLDDLMSLQDDVQNDDLEKRAWTYKCEQSECNKRCLQLLKLPHGECGHRGKCYCRRKP